MGTCDNCLRESGDSAECLVAKSTDVEGAGMRRRDDMERALDDFGLAVWRMCVMHLRSQADAQDAYQETFLRYATADTTAFNDSEHEKAWLLRVAANICTDMNRRAYRRDVSLDAAERDSQVVSCDLLDEPESFTNDVIRAFQTMSDPPKTALYLNIYEGYKATEIAELLDVSVNTVYSWISRGRKQLQEVLS